MCTVFIVGTVHFLINHWWFPLYTEQEKKVFGGHSESQSSCQEVTPFPPSATDDICCIGWQGCLFAPHCPHIATGGHVASDASVRCQGDCQHTETRGPGESRQTGNTSWHPGTQNSQTQKYSTIQVIRGSLRCLSWIEGEQNFTWNRFYVIMLDFPNTKSFSIYMLKLSSFFLGCIIKEIKLIIQQSSDC